MNRLQRRAAVLRGKRNSTFDRDHAWYDRAGRTRLARQVRVLLRAGRSVVLVTPRWSRAQQFLDDVGTDLALGTPEVAARTLSLAPLRGLTAHQAWAWLAGAVAEFCQAPLAEGPAWQAVSRRGFRSVMKDLFARAEGGRRRCLMVHGLEAIHVEALRDLVEVFREHVDAFGPDRSFNLLLAGSSDVSLDDFQEAVRVELRDFSAQEAVEALVEHLGPAEPHRLSSVVGVVGGVPALLDALAVGGERGLTDVLVDRNKLWRALGPVADELRSAFDIVNSNADLAGRLERLARQGPLPAEPERDVALVRSGLVHQRAQRSGTVSEVRAPWFADLVMSQ